MRVLIIDNYDSFIYNLAQYVGELGAKPIVYRSGELTLKKVIEINPDRIILSPGPGHPANRRYFGVCLDVLMSLSRRVPTLGVCLGHQGIIFAFGGRVVRAKRVMHGRTSLICHDGLSVFKGIENPFRAARYHSLVGDESALPSCLKVTARSLDDNEVMGVRHKTYPIEGVQFHPESILTDRGKDIIKNFLDLGIRHDS